MYGTYSRNVQSISSEGFERSNDTWDTSSLPCALSTHWRLPKFASLNTRTVFLVGVLAPSVLPLYSLVCCCYCCCRCFGFLYLLSFAIVVDRLPITYSIVRPIENPIQLSPLTDFVLIFAPLCSILGRPANDAAGRCWRGCHRVVVGCRCGECKPKLL